LAHSGKCQHLTDGFMTIVAQFKGQKPYDVPLAEQYEVVDGVCRTWVYTTDKPITSDHLGGPGTEIKI
jgi:hypothetical protein